MYKISETGEIEIMPNWETMKEVTFENGKIVKVVFRDAEEILNIRRRLTPLALDGGDSAALQALSTPEVLSTLQGESTPAHRK